MLAVRQLEIYGFISIYGFIGIKLLLLKVYGSLEHNLWIDSIRSFYVLRYWFDNLLGELLSQMILLSSTEIYDSRFHLKVSNDF